MIKSILHISDTHSLHRQLQNLPLADVIVHSGDLTSNGNEDDAIDFMEWFFDLPYKYKIFIAGNHDDCLHHAKIDGLPDNCFYLCYTDVIIEGIKFYGVPMFVEDDISGEYEKQLSIIPTDTDILITHQPPYGILDFSSGNNYGSDVLLQKVLQISPKMHLFGHIHIANGVKSGKTTIFSNACVVGEDYKCINLPHLLKI